MSKDKTPKIKSEAEQITDLKARLKKAVEVLSKILPTWQGGGIKAQDVAEACELIKRETEEPR